MSTSALKGLLPLETCLARIAQRAATATYGPFGSLPVLQLGRSHVRCIADAPLVNCLCIWCCSCRLHGPGENGWLFASSGGMGRDPRTASPSARHSHVKRPRWLPSLACPSRATLLSWSSGSGRKVKSRLIWLASTWHRTARSVTSQSALAKALGQSKATVHRRLHALSARGAITLATDGSCTRIGVAAYATALAA